MYTYNNLEVPEGVELRDASDILDQKTIFKYKDYDSYAAFANLFRYKLLFEVGGIWVDTDIICLKPLRFNKNTIFAGQRLKAGGSCANNNVIKVRKGNIIMKECLQYSMSVDNENLKWGETGPSLLSKVLLRKKLIKAIAHPILFNPIDWWNWQILLQKHIDYKFSPISYSIHLWNEMWRRNKINKYMAPEESTIYDNLLKKFV